MDEETVIPLYPPAEYDPERMSAVISWSRDWFARCGYEADVDTSFCGDRARQMGVKEVVFFRFSSAKKVVKAIAADYNVAVAYRWTSQGS